MTFTRSKRYVAALLAILLLAAVYRALHLFFPDIWLPATAEAFQKSVDLQRVNPHMYDSQWFDAARAGRIDITDALLKAGFPVNSRTSKGYTALVLATYHGDLDEVNLLLSAGADPCIADHSGNSALMGALFKGEMAIARRLIDLCSIGATNLNGQTALSFAALFGRLDILEDLMQRGADLQHRDAKGNSVMMIVEQQGNEAAVLALEALGAERKRG